MNNAERIVDYQPSGVDQPPVDAADAIPEHVGRYRIDKILDQGGFALVYLAHDGQLQRLVAIRVPHRKLVDRPETAEAL
jgi:serine/threonine protein kinase